MVTLTQEAKDKLRTLIAAEADGGRRAARPGRPGGLLGLRVRPVADARRPRATRWWTSDGVRVIVDRFSVPYLLGVELDYEEGFQGAGFLINNPNASASCGCGKSFQA